MITGDDVRAAQAACHGFLAPHVAADWSAEVPDMDFTVASVVAHAANAPLWYALDLWGGPGDDAAFELNVDAGAANAALLVSLRSAARVCAASVDAAPAGIRGFHPAGAADPSGFAAMACDEILIHTDDAARGLGLTFTPDGGLAERVLARLFPWHELGADDGWQLLRWANGRIDLPGRPNQRGWRWHCAPLADWDGKQPSLTPPSRLPGGRLSAAVGDACGVVETPRGGLSRVSGGSLRGPLGRLLPAQRATMILPGAWPAVG